MALHPVLTLTLALAATLTLLPPPTHPTPPPCAMLPPTHLACSAPSPCPPPPPVGSPTPTAPNTCFVLSGIPCSGPRNFTTRLPCVTYAGHSYPVAVALSLTLGFLGADRLYMGYVLLGVLKLFTLGGFGFWWLVDLGLLASGSLLPAHGLWEPYR